MKEFQVGDELKKLFSSFFFASERKREAASRGKCGRGSLVFCCSYSSCWLCERGKQRGRAGGRETTTQRARGELPPCLCRKSIAAMCCAARRVCNAPSAPSYLPAGWICGSMCGLDADSQARFECWSKTRVQMLLPFPSCVCVGPTHWSGGVILCLRGPQFFGFNDACLLTQSQPLK